jgi:Rieske Fe-S protein
MVKQGKAIRRRDFVKAVAIGGMAAGVGAGALGASMISLLPPAKFEEFVPGSYGFTYTAGVQQAEAWFKPLVGKPVKASDFPLNGGALAFWVGVPCLKPCWILYLDPAADHVVPAPGGGTQKVAGLSAPEDASLIQYGRGVFVGFYGGCVHACCIPGWKEAYPSLDIFHCTCHNSRYDPWSLVRDVDDKGKEYTGALRTQLPAQRSLPYIPLALGGDGNTLLGEITEENKDWYGYCGVKKKESR